MAEMNAFQLKLYNDLMALTGSNGKRKRSTFYFKDHTYEDRVYRIFNYMLASYSDFCKENALECRGHMYEITNAENPVDRNPIRLAALPVQKFFNVNENPMTQNLIFDSPMQVMRKEDGSLISTFIHNGKLDFKTKMSLDTSYGARQVKEVKSFLRRPANQAFHNELESITNAGFTVNLEWTSPINQIVLPYAADALTVLCMRNRADGTFHTESKIDSDEYPQIRQRWVEKIPSTITENMTDFMESYKKEKGIEGYVIQLATGQFVKAKTEWYCSLHRVRGSLDGELLYKAVVQQESDDIKSMCAHIPQFFSHIERYEETVADLYSEILGDVEQFYESNKERPRKEYYALAYKQFSLKLTVNLIMKRYIDEIGEDKYKDALMTGWRHVKDRFTMLDGCINDE